MRKSEKAATRDAHDLQAQLSEAWSQQFGRSGETYGRFFAAMREEFTGFVQRRLDANAAAVHDWWECRSFNDALAIQQRWLQDAVDQYVDQGNRIIETCRLAATDITDGAQTATETATKQATERRTSTHRPGVPDFKQAA